MQKARLDDKKRRREATSGKFYSLRLETLNRRYDSQVESESKANARNKRLAAKLTSMSALFQISGTDSSLELDSQRRRLWQEMQEQTPSWISSLKAASTARKEALKQEIEATNARRNYNAKKFTGFMQDWSEEARLKSELEAIKLKEKEETMTRKVNLQTSLRTATAVVATPTTTTTTTTTSNYNPQNNNTITRRTSIKPSPLYTKPETVTNTNTNKPSSPLPPVRGSPTVSPTTISTTPSKSNLGLRRKSSLSPPASITNSPQDQPRLSNLNSKSKTKSPQAANSISIVEPLPPSPTSKPLVATGGRGPSHPQEQKSNLPIPVSPTPSATSPVSTASTNASSSSASTNLSTQASNGGGMLRTALSGTSNTSAPFIIQPGKRRTITPRSKRTPASGLSRSSSVMSGAAKSTASSNSAIGKIVSGHSILDDDNTNPQTMTTTTQAQDQGNDTDDSGEFDF